MYIIPIIILGAIVTLLLFNNKQFQKTYSVPNYKQYNTGLQKIMDYPDKLKIDTDKPYFTNKTNNDYESLIYFMNYLSQNQVKFNYNDELTLYTRNDIDQYRREEIYTLINPILERINEMAQNKFRFHFVGVENVRKQTIKDTNFRSYIIDFNVWDIRTYSGYRLRGEIIMVPQITSKKPDDKLNVAKLTTPEFPKYFGGYPTVNQLIPLPSQVSVTGKFVMTDGGIDYPTPTPYSTLFLNWIEIFNSNLTLNAEAKYVENGVGGTPSGNLEFSTVIKEDEVLLKNANPLTAYVGGEIKNNLESSPISNADTMYSEPAKAANQWIRLYSQPQKLQAWPCTPYPKTWNEWGVPDKIPPETKNCHGHRSSMQQTPLTVSYDPSMFNNPRNSTSYQWMFNLENGGAGGINRIYP